MKIELSVYKVLCFTETWLDDGHSSSVYFPSNFEAYRCDRKIQTARRSGGVAILVHNTLKSKSIAFPSTIVIEETCEFLAVEIFIKPHPLIIYVCYMNVFDMEVAMKHYRRIEFVVDSFRNHTVAVIGDFNLHDIVWTRDGDAENVFLPHTLTDLSNNRSIYQLNALDFLEKILSLPMSQLSNFRNDASNVLDLVLVNEPGELTLCKDQHTIIEQSQQDSRHIPYEINVDYSANSSVNVEYVTVYQYARGNYERLVSQLEAINFQHEFKIRDVDSAYEFFLQTMKNVIDQNIPKVTIKKYTNKPKWWTPELQRLKNRRDKLFKRKSGMESIMEYEAAEKSFSELNGRLFDEHNRRTQENIKSNPKEFWKYVKMDGGYDKYPSEMHWDCRVAKSKSEIVDLFADYFESLYVPDDETWDFDDIYAPVDGAEDIQVSLFDIEAAIHSLDWNSGAGPDELKPLVIKMCASTVAWPIWLLYQKSFDVGKIADALKISRIVAVHKRKGHKTNVKNYRVIAIQPVVLKIHEIAVKRKTDEMIQPRLTNSQHGFRNKRSVVTNLLCLSILAHKAFEHSCQLDLFYGDYKAAFDTVWIRLLIVKLARFGIGRKTARWLCQFLIGRTNYVQIGTIKSRVYQSPSGVPPGSVLGPQMFTVYINDVVEVVESAYVLLFADDIKLAKIIYDHTDIIRMQRDIDNVLRWNVENRLHFNEGKCFIFSAYRSETSFIKAEYTMDDHVIERVEEISDLSVLTDRKFHFGHHMEQLTIKCRQIVGCIKHYSNGNFTKETQRILYVAYVRSRLEFASIIWNPAASIYKDDIESIQKQFVIYLLESRRNATSYRLAPYVDRCEQLKLQSLELRRTVADAMLAFDIYKRNVYDDLITSKFVPSTSGYNLRPSTIKLLAEPREFSPNQPIVRLIRLINEYGDIVTDCDNRLAFKKRITEEIDLRMRR